VGVRIRAVIDGEVMVLTESNIASDMSGFGDLWPTDLSVSVLVAAWNESNNIERHIASFLALDGYANMDLIVCAGGQDGTHNLAMKLAGPRVKVLEQHPGEGKQRALNRCLQQASGDVILLTDAGCYFTEQTVRALLDPLVRGAATVVTGVSEPAPDQRDDALVLYQWLTDRACAAEMPPIVDGVLGRNCAMLRSVLDDIGGFDAPVATGTDYFMSRRLVERGHVIHTAPSSRMASIYPSSPTAYLNMWRRWNKNLLIHGPRFGAWRDVRGVLFGFGISGAMFGCAIGAPWFGRRSFLVSTGILGACVLSRWRRVQAGSKLARVRVSPRLLAGTLFGTALDLISVPLAVYDALIPWRRARW